jgi:hypothetical protein
MLCAKSCIENLTRHYTSVDRSKRKMGIPRGKLSTPLLELKRRHFTRRRKHFLRHLSSPLSGNPSPDRILATH